MKIRRQSFHRPCVAIVVGVLTTVAISWLAMFLPLDQGRWYGPETKQLIGVASRGDDRKSFEVRRGRNAWHEVTTYWWMQISGQSMWLADDDPWYRRIDLATLPAHFRPESIDDLDMMSWYHATGWPMPAMTCGVHWDKQILNSNITYRVTDGMQLPRDADFNPRALPLRPLWPGFAVDALLYATFFWMLMLFAGELRRRHRVKRHLCVHCRYSRKGLTRDAKCPECGCAPCGDVFAVFQSVSPIPPAAK